MRLVNVAGVLLLAACAPALREVPRIGMEEFSLLATQRGTLVLDVRTFDEFEGAPISGAVSFPAAEAPDRIDELETYRNRLILIYATKSGQAAKVASELKRNGFKDVRIFDAGHEPGREEGE